MEKEYKWSKNTVFESPLQVGIVADRVYEFLGEVKTNTMFSGVGYLIKNENGNTIIYDSDYFYTDLEYDCEKYNL